MYANNPISWTCNWTVSEGGVTQPSSFLIFSSVALVSYRPVSYEKKIMHYEVFSMK